MLRIRKADGSTVDVPEGTFVEMFNPHDGALGSVWFQQSKNCILRILPGSVDAYRYADMFNVKFNNSECVLSHTA